MITPAQTNDYPRLIEIWESAVRATHHFLQPEDIAYYKERLPLYFAHVNLYVYQDNDEVILAFIGVSDGSIEMLFVDNAWRRKGIGNRLMDFAQPVGHTQCRCERRKPSGQGILPALGV